MQWHHINPTHEAQIKHFFSRLSPEHQSDLLSISEHINLTIEAHSTKHPELFLALAGIQLVFLSRWFLITNSDEFFFALTTTEHFNQLPNMLLHRMSDLSVNALPFLFSFECTFTCAWYLSLALIFFTKCTFFSFNLFYNVSLWWEKKI